MHWKRKLDIATVIVSVLIAVLWLFDRLTTFSNRYSYRNHAILISKTRGEQLQKANDYRLKAWDAFKRKDYAAADVEIRKASATKFYPGDYLLLADTYEAIDQNKDALAAYTVWVHPPDGWSTSWSAEPRVMMRYASLSLAAGNRGEAEWAIEMAKCGDQGNYQINNKSVLDFVLPKPGLYCDYASVETASRILDAYYANSEWQYIERSLVTLDRVQKMTISDGARALIHFERARELGNLNEWATPKYGGPSLTIDTSRVRIEKEYLAAARYDRKYRFLYNSLCSYLTPKQLKEIYGGATVDNQIAKR